MKVNKNEIIQSLGEIDLFICASGFESRSTSLALLLDEKSISNGVMFHQMDNYSVSEKNMHEFRKKFSTFEVVEFPKNKPFDAFEIFISNIDKYIPQLVTKEIRNIVVDITAFTREILLILLKILTSPCIKEYVNVILAYMPAQSYQENWMTKGVREVRPILGYSGLLSPSKPSLLVALTGFEIERLRTVIDIFEISHLLLGKPCKESSINNDLFIISESKCEQLKTEYQHLIKDDCFTFSCQDIKKTKEVILDIYNRYKEDFNIIVIPLNNKISTLGVAFAALEEEGIQVCYPSANQYNIDNYSTPSELFFIYNVNDI